MTPQEYAETYSGAEYWFAISHTELDSDGCTGLPAAPALAHLVCREHDLLYETHENSVGEEVDRSWVDHLFRLRLVNEVGFGADQAKLWWFGVRAMGWAFWGRNAPMDLGRAVYLEAP